MSRDDSWLRSKRHGEKWPRFGGEVPPELAEELDAHIASVRLRHGKFSRGDAVRAGLRMYLNHQRPEPEAAIDSTAVDLPDLELERAA